MNICQHFGSHFNELLLRDIAIFYKKKIFDICLRPCANMQRNVLLKYDMVMVNTWQNMISILNMYREYAVHLLLSQSLCCVVLCCVAFYVNFTKKHTNTHVCCIQQKIIIRNIPTVFSVLVSSLDVTANVLNNLNRFNCKYEFE